MHELPARVYLDYNASAPLRPEVADSVVAALGVVGNPSSVHAEGREARKLVEEARERVAALVNARPQDVVFTGGGTEANNAVLSPGTRRKGKQTTALIVSSVEHPSVRSGHRFPSVEEAPVTATGQLDLERLAAQLEAREGVVLVSIMAANNETGVLQPVAEAARLVRETGHILHTDAIQAAGKLPIDIAALGADILTLSAHKIGGPKGVGAIVLNGDSAPLMDALVKGGGQERTRRAGTENVPGIVGFGRAAELALSEQDTYPQISRVRDFAERGIVTISPEAVILGQTAPRLPNTLCFAVPGLAAETAVIAFDLKGIALSSGSACSSGKVGASHVLQAMGRGDLARHAIRVSFGWASTPAEAERFLEAWKEILGAAKRKKQAA